MSKSKKHILRMIALITIILILFIGVISRRNLVKYISRYTATFVEANIVNCLNNASSDAISKYKEIFTEFLEVEYGTNNAVTLLNVNMLYINCLQRDIAALSLEYLIEYCGTHTIYVPSGAFLGSVLLAGKGHKMKINLIPIGATSADYRIEYISAGINSTKFSIYIDLYADVKIVIPFYATDVHVSTSILVIESIIQGDVPPYLIS